MSDDGSIRGSMEIQCPRCDKWEPMAYDYSVTVRVVGNGESHRMSADVTGFIERHECLRDAEVGYGW